MDTDGMDLGPALVELCGHTPEGATLTKLRGDASTRSYYRLTAPGSKPESCIIMRLPEDALKSDEGGAGPVPSELPFINLQRHLAARGVSVPQVYLDHTARGQVWLEDLGDRTFEQRLHDEGEARWESLYGQAVDALVDMHQRCAPPGDCLCYERRFDRELLRWELSHFREWGLEHNGIALSESQGSQLDGAFDTLTEQLLELPQGFVHRDYQSRNLMWAPDGRLVIIDFQDALQGPVVYDLVALLCDSYVTLPLALQRALIRRYAEGTGADPEHTERAFWLVATHRKLKDAGRFVYIDQVRSNPDFLPWFSPSLVHVGRALAARPELSDIAKVLEAAMPGFPDAVPQPERATGQHAGAE